MTDERIKSYLRIAKEVASRSYCEKAKVGAVIVKDDYMISEGYNGTPKGFPNVCELDGKTMKHVLHAESNAITQLARSTQSSVNSSLFVTLSPCMECAKLIVQAGIKEVYFLEQYKDNNGVELLEKAGIYYKQVTL